MPEAARTPLKDIARRAVQAELVAVAQRLFAERGYEATTVDQIASEAGMSRRTFFRYFASKEDLVLEKYALFGERLRESLRARPDDEPLWDALRAMFETATGPDDAEPQAIERVVDETPTLRASYLYRLESMQRDLADEARERAARAGNPYAAGDPTPEVLVGTVFACMLAARAAAGRAGTAWPEAVDRAMTALSLARPSG